MAKKTKKTSVLFSDFKELKEYRKTDYGKSSRLFLILGFIISVVGCFGIGFIMGYITDASENIYVEILACLALVAMLGAYLVGIYMGQYRYYSYVKSQKK